MKVKIGDKVYSPEEQPIMLILEPIDKLSIAHMKPDVTSNCWHPRDMTVEQVTAFMNGTEVGEADKPTLPKPSKEKVIKRAPAKKVPVKKKVVKKKK